MSGFVFALLRHYLRAIAVVFEGASVLLDPLLTCTCQHGHDPHLHCVCPTHMKEPLSTSKSLTLVVPIRCYGDIAHTEGNVRAQEEIVRYKHEIDQRNQLIEVRFRLLFFFSSFASAADLVCCHPLVHSLWCSRQCSAQCPL